MSVSRKDMLLEGAQKPPINREILTKDLDDGGALLSMLDMRGWKLLLEGYIKPMMEEARFLSAPSTDLADVRAEIRVLKGLMKFISTRIDKANDAAEKIKQ